MSRLAAFQAAWAPNVLAALRIMSALLFLAHGTQKLFGFPPSPMASDGALPPLLMTAGLLEVIGGILLGIGLFTRPVAFVLSGMMAVAYFLAHAPRGLYPATNGGDAAILFCFIFLYLFFAGGGSPSLDTLIARRKS